MYLAYVISAYRLPDQLARLVTRLRNDRSYFAIHVDKNTDDTTYHRMVALMNGFPNVQFLERHRHAYGGFSHVYATIKGIAALMQRRIPFDYCILMTGQDYPIKSTDYIHDFFVSRAGWSFLEYFPLPTEYWDDGGTDRIESWHVRIGGHHIRIPGRSRLGLARRFPAGLQPFGGSAYWCLSRECIEYIYDFIALSPSYVRFFKYVDVPDEIFFQTIVLNSPLREHIVNDDLRYVEWRNPAIAGGPALLGRDDFDNIMNSPKLFARKFDTTQDAKILDMIDTKLADD
jgi:hypothetical protein